MVHFNLTALAAAATAFSITDFQGHFVDLASGGTTDFVPVRSFAKAENQNQETSNQNQFRIQNNGVRQVISFPSATYMGYSGIIGSQQAIAHPNAGTSWNLVGTGNGEFNLIESNTGLALTAWTARTDSSSSPLTLEVAASDPQQAFTIQPGCAFSSEGRLGQDTLPRPVKQKCCVPNIPTGIVFGIPSLNAAISGAGKIWI
ncbi:hypothetical protein HETIRDRAFT_120798 [Heterobasidion irregulare TC 32-1]|uniref:Ricin B lectin domain-containing protein n=1 Tax=Heterobasidion irregulare (strain TC 32-1) TaxID=747525 RepID=W4K9W4_HETIT|nr:uncharacterized protein HETIRDRAFT_120798 [Heterobasidion irregulare TC 32-1]ETW82544.1 hypothetical protein HETIRDRAFT_120798 [Heterobasidion irregulare TC 32-1]